MSLEAQPNETGPDAQGQGAPLPSPRADNAGPASPSVFDGPLLTERVRGEVNALLVSAELLLEDFDALPTNEMWQRMAAMNRHAFSVHHLVENLLCAANIEEGRFRIYKKTVELEDLIAAIQPVVAPLLAQKGQRLEVVTPSTAPLSLDPRRICQALVNLIVNASAFSGNDYSIEIRLVFRGAGVRIAVLDRGLIASGPGGRSLAYPTLSEATALGAESEIALSLAVVKAIVEAHGGTVGANARRNGGARYWFHLPWTSPDP